METKIIDILMKEANKAYKADEIPVGAVITRKDKIIATGHNNKQKKHDVTGHAEIIAIKKAAKKLKDWRLEDCTLYVTLEPCNMCKEVIRQSRISKVCYLLDSSFNSEINKEIEYSLSTPDPSISETYNELLKKYFRSKRNKH